ncbi:MAG: SAM-dependent methyltransferase [Neisseriaceae bacterium]|nr:MAG: SAM-dependent methyltransferase [Neisseriaceae bacterium]
MADISAFSNRLRKNLRHWSKWARRNAVSCYRLYDRDVPEYPFVVDLYGDQVHLQEVETGWQIEEDLYRAWLDSVVAACAEVLQLLPAAIHLKQRRRQKGLDQYEKTGQGGEDFIVEEGGVKFIVNLDQYLDVGLFLDHRNTRAMVREEARGKRFLNLFAYTGSFTVYAAHGGAASSVTVDMSNTYQAWTQRNLQLNGLSGVQHQLVRADVFRYLEDAAAAGEQFDLIVMDPPTFSNSAKMQGVLDVQRDHVWLIDQCLGLLSSQGVLYFSTNLRSFVFDERLPERCQPSEISARTVPEDFRNKKIHRCWKISRL